MKPQRMASSKLLERRWKQEEQRIHRERLRSVKSAVRETFRPPFAPDPAVRKAKAEATAERKYYDIERENRILLEKMSNIMQDNRPKLYNPKRYEVVSLNRERRKKELTRITVENQAILRRLQDKQPTYSVNRWENDYGKTEQYRNNLIEYPYEFSGGQGNTRTRYMMTTADLNDPTSKENGDAMNQYMAGGNTKAKGMTGSQSMPGAKFGPQSMSALGGNKPPRSRGMSGKGTGTQSAAPVIRQAENLDENRIVLYKRSKQLGQGYYIVEISSNNTHLFIAAYDVESPESLLIELPERRAQEILKEFENDYDRMASSLQVINKRLVLLNPKFVQQKRAAPQASQQQNNANRRAQMTEGGEGGHSPDKEEMA